MGPTGVECSFFGFAKSAGDLGDSEVIVAILGGSRAGTLIGKRDIPFFVIVLQATAAFLLRIRRGHLSIVNHGCKRGLIIDTLQAFYPCIGNNDIGVRATLSAPVVVSAASVGHVTGMAIDVDKRTDNIALTVRRDQGKQWTGTAIGIPDAVVVIVVWLRGLPTGILAGPVCRHQHHVVHRGVELTAL